MTYAIRLSTFFFLAATAAAGCGLGSEEPQGTSGPLIEDEESLDGVVAFQADGASFTADGEAYRATIADGTLRMASRLDGAAPVAFATTTIRRTAVLDTHVRAAAVSPDGAVAVERGAVVERIGNTEDGLEQSWRFAEPVDGAGDLVVDVAVSGFDRAAVVDSGLRFDAGTEVVSYSHATWVGGDGVRTSLPVTWAGDRIRIQVPAALVDGSAYPAVLDPTISLESTVDTQVPGFSGGRAREPAISLSTNRYLIVWRDDREGHGSDIYGARVNSDGTIFDTKGFRIAATPSDEGTPAVAWLGGGLWLVAWAVDDADVAAATVSTSAVVTTLGTVAGTGAAERNVALAASGSAALLTWQSDDDIRAARFAGGAFSAAFDVTATAAAEQVPTVSSSSTGGDYLVAWQDGSAGQNVRAQRVTSAGALDGAAFDVSIDTGAQLTPAATWDGTQWVVVWKSRGDIWGTRIATDGTVVDTTDDGDPMTPVIGGVAVHTTTATVLENPTVSCYQTNCLVAWEDRQDTVNLTTGVFGQLRAVADFTAVGATFSINDRLRSQSNAAISTASGGGYAVAWDDRFEGIHNVELARLDTGGVVQDATPILVNTHTVNSHHAAVFARSANGQLAVWSDSRSLGSDIMGRRYSATGSKLDDTYGARTVSAADHVQLAPDIDFNGANYVIAWADARGDTFDIYATRMNNSGGNLNAGGIALATEARNQLAPTVASGSTNTLVAWSDESDTTTRADIAAALVRSNGTFTKFDVCRNAGEQRLPTAAWDPINAVYVVVWEDDRGGDVDLYATRVQPDGVVLDGCGILVAGGAGDQTHAGLATSGSQLLLVWDDNSADLNGDILSARLTAAGAITVVDATPISLAVGPTIQVHGAVGAINNGRWSLAWEDQSSLETEGANIVGNEMAADGTLLQGYVIANSAEWEASPSFQAGINDSKITYLMYQRTRLNVRAVKSMRRKLTH